jgi:hypothetical protein
MIISCFGPPPKPKSKHRKKPAKRPDPPAERSPTASVMDLERDVYAYMMRDGSWRPSKPRDYWWSPSEIFAQAEWKTHRKTMDSAYDQAKGTDDKITKLQANISNLQSIHSDHAKSSEQGFSKLQGSVGELQDAQSEHAKKQDACLAEVQKMYEHLAAEARKRDDQERERYFRARLDESYELGRKHGKKKAAAAAAAAEAASSSRLSPQQLDDDDDDDDNGYAHELRALRVELAAEKHERHARHQREAQRRAEEAAVERVLRRQRRLDEEERERFERHRRADDDRIRRLADRLWQERRRRGASHDVDVVHDGDDDGDTGHGREGGGGGVGGGAHSNTYNSMERDRRPYWVTKLALTHRGGPPPGPPPRPPPPPPPPQAFHPTGTTTTTTASSSMRYVDYLAAHHEDNGTPWMEEDMVEEYPIRQPISRKERGRTTLRGPCRRIHYS